jgi:serine-type D-Ala-D-Ala carboxypeptidase (penicillin-binding protein 5/6)
MRSLASSSSAGRDRSRTVPAAAVAIAAMLVLTVLTGTAAALRHRSHPAPPEDIGFAAPKLTGPYAAACAMEPTTGTIIFDHDMHKPWPTASLAKMMVMLIVAEKLHDRSLELTDRITASHNAARMGGSQIYLTESEVFSLDDLMKAVVVHSANDATVAVAEYIAGSTGSFVQMMNRRAAELGMKDTRYYSVHGLPPDFGQTADVSSAYDCAILARELVKYPDVMRWAAIDTAPLRRLGNRFLLRNTNHLIRTFPGCDGLKTGFYGAAGFNVVATAHRNGLRLIAVVLGSPRKARNFSEAAALLSQGFLDYEMYQVATKGAPSPASIQVTGAAGQSLKPLWSDDVALFLKRGQEQGALKISYSLPASIAAPIKAGQRLGTANVTLDGKPAATVSLIAPADVAKKSSLLGRLFGLI